MFLIVLIHFLNIFFLNFNALISNFSQEKNSALKTDQDMMCRLWPKGELPKKETHVEGFACLY